MLVTFMALALAASSTLAHTPPLTPRKSLSFGPVHPHAKFTVGPAILTPSFRPISRDPIEIARRFADEVILPKGDSLWSSYVVREDSYTDSTTGVTYVYLRQLVNGIEVADGDININVLDGKVISYGDSVRGSHWQHPYIRWLTQPPASSTRAPPHPPTLTLRSLRPIRPFIALSSLKLFPASRSTKITSSSSTRPTAISPPFMSTTVLRVSPSSKHMVRWLSPPALRFHS